MPRRDRGLRAGSVVLSPGAQMDWHSTQSREELLIMVGGRVQVETRVSPGRPRREHRPARRRRPVTLNAGHCAFVPKDTVHRVVNRSEDAARYLYVTAPATPRLVPLRGTRSGCRPKRVEGSS